MNDRPLDPRGDGPTRAGPKPSIAEVAAWLRRAAEQSDPADEPEGQAPPPGGAAPADGQHERTGGDDLVDARPTEAPSPFSAGGDRHDGAAAGDVATALEAAEPEPVQPEQASSFDGGGDHDEAEPGTPDAGVAASGGFSTGGFRPPGDGQPPSEDRTEDAAPGLTATEQHDASPPEPTSPDLGIAAGAENDQEPTSGGGARPDAAIWTYDQGRNTPDGDLDISDQSPLEAKHPEPDQADPGDLDPRQPGGGPTTLAAVAPDPDEAEDEDGGQPRPDQAQGLADTGQPAPETADPTERPEEAGPAGAEGEAHPVVEGDLGAPDDVVGTQVESVDEGGDVVEARSGHVTRARGGYLWDAGNLTDAEADHATDADSSNLTDVESSGVVEADGGDDWRTAPEEVIDLEVNRDLDIEPAAAGDEQPPVDQWPSSDAGTQQAISDQELEAESVEADGAAPAGDDLEAGDLRTLDLDDEGRGGGEDPRSSLVDEADPVHGSDAPDGGPVVDDGPAPGHDEQPAELDPPFPPFGTVAVAQADEAPATGSGGQLLVEEGLSGNGPAGGTVGTGSTEHGVLEDGTLVDERGDGANLGVGTVSDLEQESGETAEPEPEPARRGASSLFDLDLAKLALWARTGRTGRTGRPAPPPVETDDDAAPGPDEAVATAVDTDVDLERRPTGERDRPPPARPGEELVAGDVELDEEVPDEEARPRTAAVAAFAEILRRWAAKRKRYPRGQLKEPIGLLRRVRAMLGVMVLTVVLGVAAGAAIGAFLLFVALAIRGAITSS